MAETQDPKSLMQAVVIGASAGGIKALLEILNVLPPDFAAAIMIVLHLHPHSNASDTAELFKRTCALPVREAQDKETIVGGTIYLAPSNYHLLVEKDLTFALSVDAKVNLSRPSIDVLFESAAEAFQQHLVGVVLSGASDDGAAGLRRIKNLGGQALVQTPESAEYPLMPQSALLQCETDAILPPAEIGHWLENCSSNVTWSQVPDMAQNAIRQKGEGPK